MKNKTFWINIEQMVELFSRDYRTIRNALHEGLNNLVVIAKFANTTINDNC